MDEILGAIGGLFRGIARAISWTLATVEEEPRPRLMRLPGPAHGPVSAIDVRLGRDRRRRV
jgi:hypothetical protein